MPRSSPSPVRISDKTALSPAQATRLANGQLAVIAKGEQSMIQRLLVLVVLSILITSAKTSVRSTHSASQDCFQDHEAWVTHTLEKIETIKPGMTRGELLKVFTEGGLSTGLHRTFISRDCSYFKVDVDFEAVGRPSRDKDGRVTLVEDSGDIIVKVSRPYLQFA